MMEVLLSGATYNVFALDLYYHNNCYINFTYAYDKNPTASEREIDELASKVMETFFRLFQRKVINDKEAYLKEMSEDEDLNDPPVTNTRTIKRNWIPFHVVGKRLVVHPSVVKPLTYTAATIQGNGMREDDLTKAFSSQNVI
jgi:hypothetical protein